MNKVYIIAEAGVNHNGSLERALEMVCAAKAMGADAVKFQLFNADSLTTKANVLAGYQKQTTAYQTQHEMLKSLELPKVDFFKLKEKAMEEDIELIVTPFDLSSLDFLVNELAVKTLKIGSGDITYGSMLLAAARSPVDLIVSTGMSNMGEVESALDVITFGLMHKQGMPDMENLPEGRCLQSQMALSGKKIQLLHCVSEYPAPPEEINLKAIDTMRQAFGVPVGLSDHTAGIEISIAAVARGASIIEKHFTLDRTLPGPDHKASLDCGHFAQLCSAIRHVESALGSGVKKVSKSENKNKGVVRRVLVAKRAIKKGSIFSEDNIDAKRSVTGKNAMTYWSQIGKVAEKDYEADEVLE